jgi:hypothetical protein
MYTQRHSTDLWRQYSFYSDKFPWLGSLFHHESAGGERRVIDAERLFFAKLDSTIAGRPIKVEFRSDDSYFLGIDELGIYRNSGARDTNDPANYRSALLDLKSKNYHALARLLYQDKLLYYGDCSSPREYFFDRLDAARAEMVFIAHYPASAEYFTHHTLSELSEQRSELAPLYPFVFARQRYLPIRVVTYISGLFQQALAANRIPGGLKPIHRRIEAFLAARSKKERAEWVAELYESLKPLYEQQVSNEGTMRFDSCSAAYNFISEMRNNPEPSEFEQQRLEQYLNDTRQCGVPQPEHHKLSEEPIAFNELLSCLMSQISTHAKHDIDQDIFQIEEFRNALPDHYRTVEPVTLDPKLVKELVAVFKRLTNDLNSRYVRHQPRGQLDMRQLVRAQRTGDFQRVFKKYMPSRMDRMRLAATILIDGSGSMAGTAFTTAINAAWSIAAALESINGKLAILEFGESYQSIELKTWSQRLGLAAPFLSSSDTDPTKALETARELLLKQRRTEHVDNLVNITVTDGEWNSSGNHHELLTQMNQDGISTVEIGITDPRDDAYCAHGSAHVLQLSGYEIAQLPAKLQGVVVELVSSYRRQIN